jgi:Rrf2 family iron-sulfur cluster assembly transcriptional regulator
VADIVLSIEEHDTDARRRDAGEPGDAGRCQIDELWATVNLRAVEFLKSISLQSLVDEQKAKGVQAATRPEPRRAAAGAPVRKPFIVDAPNSVFALGRRHQQGAS